MAISMHQPASREPAGGAPGRRCPRARELELQAEREMPPSRSRRRRGADAKSPRLLRYAASPPCAVACRGRRGGLSSQAKPSCWLVIGHLVHSHIPGSLTTPQHERQEGPLDKEAWRGLQLEGHACQSGRGPWLARMRLKISREARLRHLGHLRELLSRP